VIRRGGLNIDLNPISLLKMREVAKSTPEKKHCIHPSKEVVEIA